MRNLCGLEKIEGLGFLRFFFAIMIFCGHYFANYRLSQFGASSVSFFFILSGFSLSFGYSERVLSGNLDFKKYMIKRIKKLYPLNIVCLLLCLVPLIIYSIQNNEPISISVYGCFVVDALLLQSWFPVRGIYFSGNEVAWFLCDIFFCYLLFPLLIKIFNHSIKYMLGLIIIYFLVIQTISSEYVHAFIYINPLFRIIDFSLGITLYLLLKKYPKLLHNEYNESLYIDFLVVLVFLFTLTMFGYVDKRYALTSLYWIPSILIIYLVVLSNIRTGGGTYCVLKSKKLGFLGALSFPFYMFHDIVIHWHLSLTTYLNSQGCLFEISNYSLIGAIACIFTTLFLAYIYVCYVDPIIETVINNLTRHEKIDSL